MKSAGIIGTGSYLPEHILTNDFFVNYLDTTDEWIKTRTGISERRKAAPGETTSDLGAIAGKRAIEDAGLHPEDIDLIITATVTPDMLFPSTACLIQEKIQAKNAAAFDLSAACSGFIYGLSIANSFVASGVYKNVLVIGAEVLSAVLDPQDRRTVVLFGDGAGAAVISEVEQGSGFLAFDLGADGSGGHVLKVDAGGSKMPASEDTIASGSHYVKMMGKEVFKFAVKILGVTGKKVLEKAGISNEEVDFLIPHQANIRIVDAALRRFKISKEKTMINLEKYGNTSGASIPIALDEAVKQGRIKDGNVVVMVGFGAGLTWASTVIKYSFPGKGERKSA